jgi:hypothetical protein
MKLRTHSKQNRTHVIILKHLSTKIRLRKHPVILITTPLAHLSSDIMVDFNVRSKVVEVHSNNKDDVFWVHDDLLRQQFGPYGMKVTTQYRDLGSDSP